MTGDGKEGGGRLGCCPFFRRRNQKPYYDEEPREDIVSGQQEARSQGEGVGVGGDGFGQGEGVSGTPAGNILTPPQLNNGESPVSSVRQGAAPPSGSPSRAHSPAPLQSPSTHPPSDMPGPPPALIDAGPFAALLADPGQPHPPPSLIDGPGPMPGPPNTALQQPVAAGAGARQWPAAFPPSSPNPPSPSQIGQAERQGDPLAISECFPSPNPVQVKPGPAMMAGPIGPIPRTGFLVTPPNERQRGTDALKQQHQARPQDQGVPRSAPPSCVDPHSHRHPAGAAMAAGAVPFSVSWRPLDPPQDREKEGTQGNGGDGTRQAAPVCVNAADAADGSTQLVSPAAGRFLVAPNSVPPPGAAASGSASATPVSGGAGGMPSQGAVQEISGGAQVPVQPVGASPLDAVSGGEAVRLQEESERRRQREAHQQKYAQRQSEQLDAVIQREGVVVNGWGQHHQRGGVGIAGGNFDVRQAEADRAAAEMRRRQLASEVESICQSWKVNYQEVKRGEMLGQGSFSYVYQAEWRSTEVALKVLNQNVMDPQLAADPEKHERQLREFLRELKVLAGVRHPNLVLFMGACTSPHFCIVTELCKGGDLYALLHTPGMTLSWQQKLKIALDVASGCAFMHSQDPPIIHRDLKSLNVLLVAPIKRTDDVPQAKVNDFGLARITSELAGSPTGHTMKSWGPSVGANSERDGGGGGSPSNDMYVGSQANQGTLYWMAPELFGQDSKYNEKVDVYAFGIVLFEIITQQDPYPPEQTTADFFVQFQRNIVEKEYRPELYLLPDGTPQILSTLMTRCWAGAVNSRPTFEEIVSTLKGIVTPKGVPILKKRPSPLQQTRQQQHLAAPYHYPHHRVVYPHHRAYALAPHGAHGGRVHPPAPAPPSTVSAAPAQPFAPGVSYHPNASAAGPAHGVAPVAYTPAHPPPGPPLIPVPQPQPGAPHPAITGGRRASPPPPAAMGVPHHYYAHPPRALGPTPLRPAAGPQQGQGGTPTVSQAPWGTPSQVIAPAYPPPQAAHPMTLQQHQHQPPLHAVPPQAQQAQ
uniref:Protein kinase domain-containing protein n=1 Tax=Chromera velia CCMP2878 TaxID=1169474 RepID=A0A0G4GY53_9ALVE|eukprot:Cvel_23825.t1-p1 / transcript=Cvel_23825.t1 / gene=Cvel_23825 / organism=Chromera_velia_CCMP2878 / gene_product=Probable serine/threonine-protein kinase pats1, putative / transcript_product=Probable serine/threonine-protein kinase pats1, putative / location=Cvel_scaffold2504:14591-18969(+) / protein_length=1038 / sequence_SO=supercontig / SO=protein_coding / is_pseudo=false